MSVPTLTGIVKQVVSGDTIVIRNEPRNSSPKVKTIVLMSILAPKLERKKKDGEEKEQPYAWEAREFLRKKLIGQKVEFFSKPFPSGGGDKELGKVFYPTKEDDITEELVANGLATVKKEKASGKQAQEPDIKKLLELEEKAKAEGKGVWSKDKDKHVRNVKYPKDMEKIVNDFKREPVSAIIESVRKGPKMMLMLDVILLPSFHKIPLAINGIKFDEDADYQEQAKFFVECLLVQQDDVQVVLDKAIKDYVVGRVLHPKGNIAEKLLNLGFMCYDDRSITNVIPNAAKLRAAEKLAKEKRLGCWKNLEITPKEPKEGFQGTVIEIINGDAIMVKVNNSSEVKKIFLSSIRSPKDATKKDENRANIPKDERRVPKTIFDVPWLFEAREFLRKKLIGKRVNVIIDYKQEATGDYREKTSCTVLVGSTNIAEQLVLNGLATVIRHREKDERSSHYEALLEAEEKAKESMAGVHGKEEPVRHRMNDCTGNRAAGLFPMLQKASSITAIVEYIMSGSRMRLFLPKDSQMLTFALSGIMCPRPSTRSANREQVEGKPFGDEALNFTKERVLQREVEISIESHDKKGCMVGTLKFNNTDLALALVEEGLAEVYSSSANRSLVQAEKVAKENKIGIWSVREDEQQDKGNDDATERKVEYKKVSVLIVSPELHIFVHHLDESKARQELENKLRQEFESNSPTTFSKEKHPPKGKLVAAKFSEDNLWYRAKVEKVIGGSNCNALVCFIDWGNRQYVPFDELAPLPNEFSSAKPFAHEYALACVELPPEHYLEDVALELVRELTNRTLGLNVEYYDNNLAHVTLVDIETKEDVGKTCIEKGYFYVFEKPEKKLKSIVEEYIEAQKKAKEDRSLIWEYGDARADDAKEFGFGK